MKTRIVVATIACLLTVLFLSPRAHAQTTSCSTPVGVVPDGRIAPPGSTYFIPGTTEHWFVFRGHAGRSYSIEVEDIFDTVSVPTLVGNIFLRTGFDTTLCTGTAVSVTNNGITFDPSVDVTFGFFRGRRVSFTAAADENFMIGINNGSASGFSYVIAVTDTTLFSPRWAVFTSTGFLTAWGFTNTTDSDISCTLSLKDNTGADVGSISFTCPANSVVFKDTTSNFPSITGNSGQAVLTHDGPAGGILADAYIVGPKPFIQPVLFQPRNAVR